MFCIGVKISPISSSKYHINKPLRRENEHYYNNNSAAATPSFGRSHQADSFRGQSLEIPAVPCAPKNFQIIKLEDIPCPSCGLIMPTKAQQGEFIETVRNATGKDLIKTLEKYKNYYQKTELKVVDEIISTAQDFQDKKLFEIIIIMDFRHRPKLENAQYNIFKNIEEISKGLSKDEKDTVHNITLEARKLVSGEDEEKVFKRKDFLREIYDVEVKAENRAIHRAMYKEAIKLPTSSSDIAAFCAKYSREKTSDRIAERLLMPSVATTEHVKPTSRGGKNLLYNYISECGYCNWTRHSIPYKQWVKEYQPDMVVNAQNYFDEVSKRINDGEIPKKYMEVYENYPYWASRVLQEESKNEISVLTQYNSIT